MGSTAKGRCNAAQGAGGAAVPVQEVIVDPAMSVVMHCSCHDAGEQSELIHHLGLHDAPVSHEHVSQLHHRSHMDAAFKPCESHSLTKTGFRVSKPRALGRIVSYVFAHLLSSVCIEHHHSTGRHVLVLLPCTQAHCQARFKQYRSHLVSRQKACPATTLTRCCCCTAQHRYGTASQAAQHSGEMLVLVHWDQALN